MEMILAETLGAMIATRRWLEQEGQIGNKSNMFEHQGINSLSDNNA